MSGEGGALVVVVVVHLIESENGGVCHCNKHLKLETNVLTSFYFYFFSSLSIFVVYLISRHHTNEKQMWGPGVS